jgi:hypothetical protein
VDGFTKHLNSLDEDIKFTIETGHSGNIAFLDVKVEVNDDASVRTKVYRKPTHTDQYLNWSSNHHLQHKRSVVRTLLHRKDHIISEEEDKAVELENIRRALAANGYKPWILQLPKKNQAAAKDQTREHKVKRHPVCVPYVQGLSEHLQRIYKSYGVSSYHKPFNTLRSLLVHPKDKTLKQQQCGVVYHIKCGSCEAEYVGETARSLDIRYKEHTSRKSTNSAVKEHLETTGHNCSLVDVKILDKEANWYRRRIKEAIRISQMKPNLNRDAGHDLSPVYQQLFSCEQQQTQETQSQFIQH